MVYAQDVDFAIIPASDTGQQGIINDVKSIANSPGNVWGRYKEISQKKRSL
ncbi:MAG: hypothetical protein GXP45_04725 [bacterium]|nr:hypothetical protein [bacterium]